MLGLPANYLRWMTMKDPSHDDDRRSSPPDNDCQPNPGGGVKTNGLGSRDAPFSVELSGDATITYPDPPSSTSQSDSAEEKNPEE